MSLFLLKMTLSMLFFMGIYQLLLAKTALHRFKRFFLLISLVLPVIIPFIELEVEQPEVAAISLHETLSSNLLPETILPATPSGNTPLVKPVSEDRPEIEPQSAELDLSFWLTLIYGLVVLILLIRFGISIYHILRRSLKASVVSFENKKVYLTEEPLVPHNFLHLVFISTKDYENTDARGRLLTHELGHARQLHSLDILMLEVLRIVFWFNPLYIFWSRAIRANHEYLADAAVISRYENIGAYKQLLLSFANQGARQDRLVSTSNYSLTKMRFIMMTKKISKTGMIFRITLLVPLVILSLVAMAVKVPTVLNTTPEVSTVTEQIPLAFEGDKPSLFPIEEKFNPEFRLHFDATMYRGTDREYNTEGVSYFAPLGTPVRATADGVVTTSKKNEKRGNYIVIKHGDEYETLYASLDESKVSVGQNVKRGETIGTVGKSIENSNVHLHYEVIKNGVRVDPKEYYLLKLTPRDIWGLSRINLESRRFAIIKSLKLPGSTRMAHFPDDWKYTSVAINQEQVVFVKGSEVIKTLKMADLTAEQKQALNGLESDMRAIERTPLRNEVIQEWQDPNKYLVIIDQKVMDTQALKAYDPGKVAFHWRAKLRKNDPEKPLYRVDALSEEGYQQFLQRMNSEIVEREQTNRKLLKTILGDED